MKDNSNVVIPRANTTPKSTSDLVKHKTMNTTMLIALSPCKTRRGLANIRRMYHTPGKSW